MQNNLPLVSIAMATYNGANYLVEQLDTLVQQTYKNVEIIVSDDGSTDDTLSILKTYADKYNNIFIYNNIGSHGIKRNFENAIKNCTGTYISLCDQDDFWMLEKISILIENITDSALIYHNSLFVNNNNVSLNNSIAKKLNCYSGTNPKAFLLFNCVSGHACMFHRKLIDIALPFPNAKFHDWWLAFVATQNGGVKYLDQILVNYRQHENSKTDILSLKKSTIHLKEIDKYEEEIEWYENCANFVNDYQPFFKKWLFLYKKRKQQWFSFSLFLLARKNSAILYTLRKKNYASIFFENLKLVWGLKLKKKIA